MVSRHKYTAVGAHVFAGGFTMGVRRAMNVDVHMETHGFGLDTARKSCGVECVNDADANWPVVKGAQMCFGNPRCTAFSTLTSSCSENAHGAWAKQTCDIWELCEYGIKSGCDIVCWESVQHAFTGVGRPLVDHLAKEFFAPNHYRLAHLLINAATFGNPQQRRRYFFVAYRDDRNFNIAPPEISPWEPVSYDVLWPMRGRQVNEVDAADVSYDRDSCLRISPEEKLCLLHLPSGWCLNTLARYCGHVMPAKFQKVWLERSSDIPFSLHTCARFSYLRPHPTLAGTCWRLIHPEYDRPITVGEAAAAMGWPDGAIPTGKMPFFQIAKGIVPDIGEWLAQQAILYLDDHWGKEDYEARYDDMSGEWKGRDTHGELHKTFDMTRYVGKGFERSRYAVTDETLHPRSRMCYVERKRRKEKWTPTAA